MPKTFDILKKRWREVGLLLLLSSILWLPQGLPYAPTLSALSMVLQLVISILAVIFRAGFLRTAYLYGEQKQEIRTLFTIGKAFFVQLFLFGIIYGLPIGLATNKLSDIFRINFGFPSLLPLILASLILSVVFIKLALFIPALIITGKLNVINAFKALKNYRILEAKELLVLFVIQQVFWAVKFLDNVLIDSKAALFATGIIETVIGQLLTLAIMLSAVKFIDENTEETVEIEITAEDAEIAEREQEI